MRRFLWLLMVLMVVSGCGPTQTVDSTAVSAETGLSMVLKVPDGADPAVVDRAAEIITLRIADLDEVAESDISVTDGETITVEILGITDSNRAVSLVTSPGRLSFRPVLEASMLISPLLGPDQSVSTRQLPAEIDPDTGLTVSDDPTQEAWLAEYAEDGSVLWVYDVGPSQLSGADLDNVLARFVGGPTDDGMWQVELDMSGEGADKFQEMTREAASQPLDDPRRQIAIVLDGKVVSAPYVSESVDPDVGIDGGMAVITVGTIENQEHAAQDLAVVLRHGALPVSFEVVSVSLLH